MITKRLTALQQWGKELARVRESAGMSQKELARAVYVSDSLIGMWETGKRAPKPDVIKRCDEVLDTGRVGLSRLLIDWVSREVPPEWLGKWLVVEEMATALLSFEPLVIPGLLQTADYAREVLQTGEHPPSNVDEKVAARLERQRVLEENSPMFVTVLDESALRRPVGGTKIMRDQLLRLIEFAERPEIIIQVVPMGVGAYSGLNGPFAVATLDGSEVAYLDNAISGEIIESYEEVAAIRRLWESIRSKAKSAEDSIQIIMETANEYDQLA